MQLQPGRLAGLDGHLLAVDLAAYLDLYQVGVGGQIGEEIAGPPAQSTATNDITDMASEVHEVAQEAPGDITEGEAPSAERSGLSGLGSRLRKRLGKKRDT